MGHCPFTYYRVRSAWVLSPFKTLHVHAIVLISLRLTPPGLQGTGTDHEGSPLLPGAGILLELWSVWWYTCVSLLLLWRVLLLLIVNQYSY